MLCIISSGLRDAEDPNFDDNSLATARYGIHRWRL